MYAATDPSIYPRILIPKLSTQVLLSDTSEMEATRFTEIVIFDTFACLGLFLNLVVLAPTLFSGVCRKVPWASLILSFILYAITYMLLIGRQRPTQHPPYGLCFFQASLVYSVPLLWVFARWIESVTSPMFLIKLCYLIHLFCHRCKAVFTSRKLQHMMNFSIIKFCLQMSIVDFGGLRTKTRSRTENVVGKQSSWTKWNLNLFLSSSSCPGLHFAFKIFSSLPL